MSKVATGLAFASIAKPELAAQAVTRAMQKAGIKNPTSVLLFLSSEFAADPQPAIKAAAKAANCTQIIGCSATGIFTEEDWILDSPAAAAMVFSDITLSAVNTTVKAPLALTLAAPNAIDSTWLNKPGLRFGGISGDASGHGPFSVWQNGKGSTQGYCEIAIHHANHAVAASHGLKIISTPRKITQTNNYDLLSLDRIDALADLHTIWDQQHKTDKQLPYHQLIAIHAKKSVQLARNEYNMASIISCNEENNSITLSYSLQEGDWLSWAVRDTDAAQIDIVKTATTLKTQLNAKPTFALLFSCLGRGPYFYDGGDQDLALLKVLFPKLPIIGFYGNGEIAPLLGKNQLLQYSAVLGLFSNSSPS
jgi:small ligand-binding sensory domain FIST